MILNCLSTIWKSGAKIKRLQTGELELLEHEKVPETCLKVADKIFDEIDAYLKSVEDMSKVDQTVWKMMIYFLGWKTDNESIKKFMLEDESGFTLFMDYQVQLMKNGWSDIYEDYRQFESDNTKIYKDLLIKRLIEFGKTSK